MINSAFDCVARGLHTLRANWQLVPVYWLQQVVLIGLSILGVVAFFLAMGFGAFSVGDLATLDGHDLEAALEHALADAGGVLLPFFLGLLAASLVWFVAFLVWCWFQAGLYGVLIAGEHRAPPGEPRDWRAFRAFEPGSFTAWARRYAWRYFGFFHLYLLVVTALLVLCLPVLLGAGFAADAWGTAGAVGVGCAGFLPLLFFAVVATLWFVLGQADLARPQGGVARSSRRALEVLGRRVGAVLLLVALMLVGSLLLSLGTLPLSYAPVLVGWDSFAASCLSQLAVYAIQIGVSGLLQVFFAGAAVALMRGGESS